MDTGIIGDRLKEEIQENTRITDSGIGFYEFWGATGVDKHMGLEYDGPDLEIDITDCFDEEETPETVIAEGLSLFVSISKSNGGDPDACAESGRRRCGSCTACDSYEETFSVKLLKVEKKEEALIGHFTIEG